MVLVLNTITPLKTEIKKEGCSESRKQILKSLICSDYSNLCWVTIIIIFLHPYIELLSKEHSKTVGLDSDVTPNGMVSLKLNNTGL